jgi:carboxypeptidase Taq
MTLYEQYRMHAQKAADLSAAQAMMNWDQETMMPAGAAIRRASQQATLAEFQHEYILNHIWPLVQELKGQDNLSAHQRLNVEQDYRDIAKRVRLPASFVAKLTEETARAQFAWEQARKANQFNRFESSLQQVIALKQEEADLVGYEASPYDALLDDYEPGATAAQLTTFFSGLRPELQAILTQVQAQPPRDYRWLGTTVPVDQQWDLTMTVLKDMGFRMEHGRQDRSSHPFTTSFGMEDVRLTTRLDPNDFTNALYSSIHEGGHGLYEQGLNPDEYGLPAAQACSLSIHESQSRLWENNIGRGLAFVEAYFPLMAQQMPQLIAGQSPVELFKALNQVQPSLIRTSADELTYHFHIQLRFELERDLIEGKLKVGELREAWNAKMKADLGLDVPSDNEGVLQDIHWSLGLFGYFPTYSLGSLYAAQFYAQVLKEHPQLLDQVRQRQFKVLLDWLTRKVFRAGKLTPAATLCQQISGEPLSVQYFLQYMKQKLSLVYGTYFH